MFDRVEYRITIGTQESKCGDFLDQRKRGQAIHNIQREACEQFGGYTVTEASGGWINPDGGLVTESAIVLTVCALRHSAIDADVAKFARRCGRLLDQHSIVLSVGDRSAVLPCH